MSVVINGMEMPISCPHCPCSDDESRFCRAANKYIPMLGKPEFCPLVTIEERKKGKWIDGKVKHIENGELRNVRECSECGSSYFVYDNYNSVDEIPKYCPNCGSYNGVADMRGET